jgi:hypothetical protein
MTARATPYPPVGFRVRIPEPVWNAALDEVRRYATVRASDGRAGSEGLVYLGGIPTPDTLMVTSLLRLHHEPQGDCVKPTPAEIRWLLSELRQRDEKLVAQLHTHRHGARHSPGDDAMATSFHDGFLSIVAPGFAVNVGRIDQCIVHEYRSGTFQPLSAAETAARFTVHAQLIDRPHPHASGEPNRWHRFVPRLKPTAHKRH